MRKPKKRGEADKKYLNIFESIANSAQFRQNKNSYNFIKEFGDIIVYVWSQYYVGNIKQRTPD